MEMRGEEEKAEGHSAMQQMHDVTAGGVIANVE